MVNKPYGNQHNENWSKLVSEWNRQRWALIPPEERNKHMPGVRGKRIKYPRCLKNPKGRYSHNFNRKTNICYYCGYRRNVEPDTPRVGLKFDKHGREIVE